MLSASLLVIRIGILVFSNNSSKTFLTFPLPLRVCHLSFQGVNFLVVKNEADVTLCRLLKEVELLMCVDFLVPGSIILFLMSQAMSQELFALACLY